MQLTLWYLDLFYNHIQNNGVIRAIDEILIHAKRMESFTKAGKGMIIVTFCCKMLQKKEGKYSLTKLANFAHNLLDEIGTIFRTSSIILIYKIRKLRHITVHLPYFTAFRNKS